MKKFKELFTEVMSTSQRRKLALRMAKLQKLPAFQLKKKRSAIRARDPAKLLVIARKQTMNVFRKKYYPDYSNEPVARRVKIDQTIQQKFGVRIDKIAKKLAMKLKRAEPERIKKARAAMGKDTDA